MSKIRAGDDDRTEHRLGDGGQLVVAEVDLNIAQGGEGFLPGTKVWLVCK